MLEAITRGTRFASLVMVPASFVGAIARTITGAEKMFHAIWNYVTGTMPTNVIEAAGPLDLFIVRAWDSLDAFLIAPA